MYSLLLAVIYLAFISLGLPDSLLGAGWPVIHAELNVPISYMGFVTMIISGCTIISSLMSERITKKIGTKYVTVISVFLTAVALFGFSHISSFPVMCLWAIPYGIGAGAIDAALNNYVALHYNSRQMSWLHCFWGLGAVASPYLMSYALLNGVWNNGYRYVSYIQTAILVVLICTLPLWKVHKNQTENEETTEVIGLRKALKIKGVPFVLIGFFAYCATESTVMAWASSYFAEVRHLTESVAAAYASLFFIGITAGRFIGGFISNKAGDRNMIRFGTAVALCGLVCVALPVTTNAIAITGFVLLGLGCAPIYPCIIHSTPYNFGKRNSQAIIGIQMASAYIGSTFMPPLFGVVGQFVSLKLLPYYCLVFFVIMIYLIEKAFGITHGNRNIEDK